MSIMSIMFIMSIMSAISGKTEEIAAGLPLGLNPAGAQQNIKVRLYRFLISANGHPQVVNGTGAATNQVYYLLVNFPKIDIRPQRSALISERPDGFHRHKRFQRPDKTQGVFTRRRLYPVNTSGTVQGIQLNFVRINDFDDPGKSCDGFVRIIHAGNDKQFQPYFRGTL